LKKIYQAKNDEIRGVLTEEQRTRFEEVLKKNKAMVGASRDVRDFDLFRSLR